MYIICIQLTFFTSSGDSFHSWLTLESSIILLLISVNLDSLHGMSSSKLLSECIITGLFDDGSTWLAGVSSMLSLCINSQDKSIFFCSGTWYSLLVGIIGFCGIMKVFDSAIIWLGKTIWLLCVIQWLPADSRSDVSNKLESCCWQFCTEYNLFSIT